MIKQITDTILMVEPVAFGFNSQTAVNNYFQRQEKCVQPLPVQETALKEFRGMTDKLKAAGINLIVVQDTPDPYTPDSIFPNNWISFHEDGRIALYPMYAENRRAERRPDIIEKLREAGFYTKEPIDYTSYENRGKYLEGTGSMVLDRVHRIAYAALSDRTDKEILEAFCADFDYHPCMFTANQTVNGMRMPIYHTNVMMCVADTYVVVCLSSVDDCAERERLIRSFTTTGKEIVDITEKQMQHFAGNMLQVESVTGNRLLVVSQRAYDSLDLMQIDCLSDFNKIIPVVVPTIETCGGGSVRCMMAEVFLPKMSNL